MAMALPAQTKTRKSRNGGPDRAHIVLKIIDAAHRLLRRAGRRRPGSAGCRAPARRTAASAPGGAAAARARRPTAPAPAPRPRRSAASAGRLRAAGNVVIDLSTQRSIACAEFHTGTPSLPSACSTPEPPRDRLERPRGDRADKHRVGQAALEARGGSLRPDALPVSKPIAASGAVATNAPRRRNCLASPLARRIVVER